MVQTPETCKPEEAKQLVFITPDKCEHMGCLRTAQTMMTLTNAETITLGSLQLEGGQGVHLTQYAGGGVNISQSPLSFRLCRAAA